MSALMVAFLQLQSSLSESRKQEAALQLIAMEFGAELARENAAMTLAAGQAEASQQIVSSIGNMMSAAMTISSFSGAGFIRASQPAVPIGAGMGSTGTGLSGIGSNALQGAAQVAQGEVEALRKLAEAREELVRLMQANATQTLGEVAKLQEEIAKMLAGLATGGPTLTRG